MSEAEELLLAILDLQADHPEANYSLGLLAMGKNKPEEGLHFFETALEKRPEHGPYWLAYIDALDQVGRSSAAREMLIQAQRAGLKGEKVDRLMLRLGMKPEEESSDQAPKRLSKQQLSQKTPTAISHSLPQQDFDALLSHYQQGSLPECENLCRSLLSIYPEEGLIWKVLGATLKQRDKLDEAVSAMKKAVELLPRDPQALNNLGLTLENIDRLDESEATLRCALALDPNFAEAHNNLGVTLRNGGRLKEAEDCFHRALELAPRYAEAHCNLGITLKDQSRLKEAEDSLRQAILLNPSYAEAYNNLGNVLLGAGRLTEAENMQRKALQLKPEFAVAFNNLGNTLHSQGRLEESMECYRQALAIRPDYSEPFDGLLFVANYLPDASAEEIYQFYQAYDQRFGHPVSASRRKPHANSSYGDRRLKIGYVSPSLYNHPVINFLEPLLDNHDKTRFELFAYTDLLKEDDATVRCRHHFDHWLLTTGMSDELLAERIRNDGIDILVDLAGHTGRNRLQVFARKPAPVSLHWLDFGYTTGLSSIDYYLTDLHSVPIGSEHLFSEQPWRLPIPSHTYRPKSGMGDVGASPALEKGFVTFATLSRAIRINHRTVRVWSEILNRVKNSRLIIDSGNFKDQAIQERMYEQFAALGIERSRLDIGFHSPPWDLLRTTDIGLDCFPHNSGTTLFENIYMGIPFVTLAGRPSVGTLGRFLLEGIGRGEWVAETEQQYIEKTVELTSDLEKLACLRRELRHDLQRSPFMDEAGFTRAVEEAYLAMFKKWEQTGESTTVDATSDTSQEMNQHNKCTQHRLLPAAIEHYNLGVDYQLQKRTDEAKSHYLQAINIQSDFVEAYNNLGVVLKNDGQSAYAVDCFHKSLSLRPDYADAHFNLADDARLNGKLFQAEASYLQYLHYLPNHADAHYYLGDVYQQMGRHIEAEKHLRHALTLQPGHRKSFSCLLFLLNYHPDETAEEVFRAYRELNDRYFAPYRQTWKPHSNSTRLNRRLKIGYMAPGYKKHPTRFFLHPLLEHHDRSSFELHAFIELEPKDSERDLFYPYVEHWFATAGLSDDEVCELIRNNSIDILVDLAGHTAGNRLDVFARKPAPVSLHWLDFGYTTGLSAIDYYLSDSICVPAGSERFFSEQPWRLTPPTVAYRPPADTGPVGDLPAQRNGFITFGTLTRAVRINHRTIRVWAQILKRCKGSRLIINSGSFLDPDMQQFIRERFATEGIEGDRLDIGCTSPPWDVLREIDIILDCFPHNSGTTLIESLYMGVPYITLTDRPSVGLLGSSILTGAGHPEWIARSEQEYVELTIELASDTKRLASIRQCLRKEIELSPLMDEEGFTAKVEAAYREMFSRWCVSHRQGDPESTISPPRNREMGTLASNPATPIHNIQNNRRFMGKHKSPKTPLSSDINKLTELYARGNSEEALQLASSLTTQFPEHGFGWKVLGPLLYTKGMVHESLDAMRRAAKCMPNDPDVHFNLGIVLQQTDQIAEAEKCYRTVLRLNKGYVQAQFNLANILKSRGRLNEAEKWYRQVIAHNPQHFEAYGNLGNVLKSLGRPAEAVECYRTALAIKGDSAELFSNLGLALADLKHYQDAQDACEQALAIHPEFTEAHVNLGIILQRTGRLEEAILCFRRSIEYSPGYAAAYNNLGLCLQQQGKLKEAQSNYDKALELSPGLSDALLNRGLLMQEQGRLVEAEESYRKILTAHPDDPKTLNNMSIILLKKGQLSEAEIFCKRALAVHPDYAVAYHNLGNIYIRWGDHRQAETSLRKALEIKPDDQTIYDNLLFLLNYDPDRTGEEIFEEYTAYNTRFAAQPATGIRPHLNNRLPHRRLKIGYVGSTQFKRHSARHCLEPLLMHHDKEQVEVFVYAELYGGDKQTKRYQELVDHWIISSGMSDGELAERIRQDSIDILIDLAGHTEKNRLGAFALKPAPVSLHWLDFGYTTGLTAIDYYMTDETIVPPGSDHLFSETPWRLQTPCVAYRADESMGEVSPLPAAGKGYVTFGTLTRAIRINHHTIRVWADILRRVKGSHLIIDSGDFRDMDLVRKLEDRFVALGVERERLEIDFHTPPWDLLRKIDIGLDCFPHNSGTTLLETLYMGIPFVTLSGRPSIGTLGSSLLHAVGHPEWVAETEDRYVELAVQLALDMNGLATLRAGLRDQMKRSPLMDEPAFARKMEKAYREMFANWCHTAETSSPRLQNSESTQEIQNALNTIADYFNSGRLLEAHDLCTSILASHPQQPTANYYLGCINVALQQPVEALPFFETALEINPESGSYWTAYIDALDKAGRREAASELLRMAIEAGLKGNEAEALQKRLQAAEIVQEEIEVKQGEKTGNLNPAASRDDMSAEARQDVLQAFQKGDYERVVQHARSLVERYPEDGFCWKALGLSLGHLKRLEESVPALFNALKLASDDPDLYHDLANILFSLGRFSESADISRKALALMPEDSVSHYTLANALTELGAADEAENSYQNAIACKPDFPEAHYNLGNLYRTSNRLGEAQQHYENAIEFNPEHFKSYCNLGIVLQMNGRLEEAEKCYKKAIEINRVFIEAHINLGACLKDQGRYHEAEDSYQYALALQPDMPLCLSNLGSVLKEQGKISEAEQVYNHVLEIQPQYIEAFSNLLFLLNYHPDKSAEEIFARYREFEERFCLARQPVHPGFGNAAPKGRRLRIGYVSPQFRQHSMRHALEPLLAHHDKKSFEIFAYAELTNEDALAERYRSYVDHWQTTVGMTDQNLAERIRADKIDILVDLAGHTAHNRLTMFALKPAPVSLHWLDFGYTTGLASIDYYLTDEVSVPPGSEGLFAEKPWRLASASVVYRPSPGMGEVNALPALRRGYVTFGTLTRAVRINHRTIRVWSRILHRVKDSRLVIDSNNFRSERMRDEFVDKFAAHGIERHRLEIGYHSPPWDTFRGLDISLDCFPHNSGTTLLESLYMGVPYITLAERPGVGRLGASLLEGLDHREWVAQSEEDYIERAVKLATDLDSLSAIRTTLREKMQNSPLMDEPAFARKVEDAYVRMFVKWFDESATENEDLSKSQTKGKLKSDKARKKLKHKSHVISTTAASVPNPKDVEKLLSLYQQGRLADAENAAHSLLERFPHNSHIWKILGAVHRQQGNLDLALKAMRKAVDNAPDDYIGLRNIAVLLSEVGWYREAEDYCRRALALNPDYADGYNTLSVALSSQKRLDEAEQSCSKGLEVQPKSVSLHINLGLILHEKKEYAGAESCFREALLLQPDSPEAFCALSITLAAESQMTEAETAARRAISLKPGFASAYNSLGTIFDAQKRYQEAEAAYRQALAVQPGYILALHNLARSLHNLERNEEAEEVFRQVLRSEPDNSEAYFNLGNTLMSLTRHDAAEEAFRKALDLHPHYPEACLNLGYALRHQGWITEAERYFRKALELRPVYEKAFNNLGNILQEQGRFEEAEYIFRTVIEKYQEKPDIFGNLLFLLNYHPDKSAEEIFQEYVRFNSQFALPLLSEQRPHTNQRTANRRLRVGYVSPQFRQHPVYNFLEPLLANHDKNRFELYAYAELGKEDEISGRYKSHMDYWIPTRGMSDSELAERIRQDGIDILVDLAGHTEHNRLLAFARKPAPVSLHWLDFGYTTGLTAIDYYLTDEATAPGGCEHLFSEKLWKIATPSFVYRPTEGMGEVNPLPALNRGYITFGCLSRGVRINHRTIGVWSRILKKVERSRLIVNSGSFKDPEMQRRLLETFNLQGIDSERLDIRYTSPPWDVLRNMDIGFDCFPHNSGTTLLENLYMGIPFITLAGRPSVGGLGSSIISGLGHPDLIARSEDEYIEKAVSLASDLPRLAAFRATLRPKMQKSPLMDEPAFARKVETAYVEMFSKWCREQQ